MFHESKECIIDWAIWFTLVIEFYFILQMQGLAVTTNQAKHIFGLVWWWKVSRRKRLANGHRLRPEFRFTHEHWLVAVFQADWTFHGRSLLFFAKSPEGNSSADEQYLYFRWGISIAKLQYPVLLYKWLFFNPDTETGYGTLCYQHTLDHDLCPWLSL